MLRIQRVAVLSVLMFLSLSLFAEEAGGKTFLWHVTSDTGGEIYLLGSIHVMKKDAYPLPKEIQAAFDRSKFLVLEADESKLDPVKMQQMVMEKGMYPAGDGISKHISKELQAELAKQLVKNNMQAAQVEQMKPWMLSVMLSMNAIMKLGYDPQMGIDKHYLKQANAMEKKVLELESAEFQLGLLSSFSDEIQEKMLKSSLLDMEKAEADFNALIAAWHAGDTAKMDAELSKNMVKEPELKPVFDKLFYDRNVTMTDKIEGYLKTKDIHFVVAGAGHMVGEKGIVKLLQNKKYKVVQISKAAAGVK